MSTTTQDQLEMMTTFSQYSQQQPQQQQKYFNDFSLLPLLQNPPQSFQGELFLGSGGLILNEFSTIRPIKEDPGLDPGFGISTPMEQPIKQSFRKRKADNKTFQPSKQAEIIDENKAKKVKVCCEEEKLSSSNSNEKNGNKESKMKENSGGSSKENQKGSDQVQKLDYIHVRARRGQATDSHSLAERVRREKISERMKYLQDLVPGCNKITGKAGMLDEIINYVQSLQRQVEFLSMKLAAVNPRFDFNIEDLFAKEPYPACSSNIPAEMANLAYLQYNSGQQMGPVCESDLGLNEAEMEIRRSINAPISIPEAFPDSSCLTQLQSCLPWDQPDLQSIYNNMEFQQVREQSFPSQTYTGPN